MSLSKALVPALAGALLLLTACGRAGGPATDEELERSARERAAALEAAEKNILDAGLPLPAEDNRAGAPIADENEVTDNAGDAGLPADGTD